jgi:TorA maturation chaperone TorD
MNKEADQDIDFQEICFGLNRETDERSLAFFIQLFSRDELLQALIPRLGDDEIIQLVDQLTAVLRNHLQEDEYHELFLGDPDHHH